MKKGIKMGKKVFILTGVGALVIGHILMPLILNPIQKLVRQNLEDVQPF